MLPRALHSYQQNQESNSDSGFAECGYMVEHKSLGAVQFYTQVKIIGFACRAVSFQGTQQVDLIPVDDFAVEVRGLTMGALGLSHGAHSKFTRCGLGGAARVAR